MWACWFVMVLNILHSCELRRLTSTGRLNSFNNMETIFFWIWGLLNSTLSCLEDEQCTPLSGVNMRVQYSQALSSSDLYLCVRREGNGWHYDKDKDAVLKCPGSPHTTQAPPAAIFLPFPKRNVISTENQNKRQNKSLLRQFPAIYLSGWAFKDARLIRHTADNSWHSQKQTNYRRTLQMETESKDEFQVFKYNHTSFNQSINHGTQIILGVMLRSRHAVQV